MPSLISVMMPCYNATKTLPLALASLVAQTYSNWECVLIDDGSTDRPVDVVLALNDPRVKLFRFERNMGRAVARQRALDLAQGAYLTMLDADDWIYPWKFERQLEIMETEPDLAVLSAGVAIVNGQNEIVGIRVRGSRDRAFTRYTALKEVMLPPIATQSAMIRMDLAKQTKYDPEFRLTEDTDYLIKILLHHPFAELNEVTYVYSELESVNKGKIVRELSYTRTLFLKYRHIFPRAVYVNIMILYLKDLVYRLAFAAGFGKRTIELRSPKPSLKAVEEFLTAKECICQARETLFGH